ncbi:MAG: DUF2920 family protein [Candidatus Hydrogenedentes bacterium]|nr:DUF2920 family protein [Candidatus Hydrogenedentota bacterium]
MLAEIVVAWICVSAFPPLPVHDDTVTLPAQNWEFAPGPREIAVYIHYPGGGLRNVNPSTGLMLCLHNWGGSGSDGAPNPAQVADRYDVIAIGVDYLQSGKWDPAAGLPYDFGYLQALDALRALHYVFQSLDDAKTPFARGRIYATGGSGGGNVALMANKLAPRTFACVVDISGMARLTDDIAFGLPGGSELNAGYSRDPNSIAYLARHAQELRDIGNPQHLADTARLRTHTKVVIVHGADDAVCPAEDAVRMAKNFESAGVSVDLRVITQDDIDGDAITGTGHALGDRTKLLFRFGDSYMRPESKHMRAIGGKTDFELRDVVRLSVTGGTYTIDYAEGYPVSRFNPSKANGE